MDTIIKDAEKVVKKGTASHDATGLALRQMKIMLSISPFYCRGLIYQARSR